MNEHTPATVALQTGLELLDLLLRGYNDVTQDSDPSIPGSVAAHLAAIAGELESEGFRLGAGEHDDFGVSAATLVEVRESLAYEIGRIHGLIARLPDNTIITHDGFRAEDV